MKYIALVLIGSLISFLYVQGSMRTGLVTEEVVVSSIRRDLTDLRFAKEIRDYVEGSITFTYPTDWFSEAPMIEIALEADMTSTSTYVFVACASANSTDATTVCVYKVGSAVIEDAETDSCKVHLSAYGS